MLALSLAPEFPLHIQVTGSYSLLHRKQAGTNQDYSAAYSSDFMQLVIANRKLQKLISHCVVRLTLTRCL